MSERKLSFARLMLLVTASTTAGVAGAQTTPQPEGQAAAGAPAAQDQSADAGTAALETIIVTGSRIQRDGYQAPTPVTVAVADDLLKAAPGNLSEGLNRLPQFIGSAGPNKSNNVFATPTHGNILNLRGLGGIRTLVLLDGLRVPATNYLGTVDVNVLPQQLVQRVDVVTAGASSAYGSDAVAGVVNFVLDTKYNGLKGVAQSGISSRGDNGTTRIGLAGGFNVTDRLHALFSYDHYSNKGYLNQDRPYLDDQGQAVGSVVGGGRAGTAANPYTFVPGVRLSLATFGGVATTGPFANTSFTTPGAYRPLITGTPTGSPGFNVGGDYYYGPGFQQASAPTTNDVGFGRLDYALSDTVSAYTQVLAAQSIVRYNSLPNLLLSFPIYSGNAFLPAPLQAQMTANNTASFNLSKSMREMGPIVAREQVRNIDVMTGLRGKLGGLTWSADYVYGNADHKFSQSNQFEWTKFAAAVDAVVDPATSQIVCRPSLSADAAVRARFAGCVPFNPFGYDASSQAARNYVGGVSTYHARIISHDVTLAVSGDVFDLPAGAVSLAVGAEYRTQKLSLDSNSNPAVLQDLTGLRGLAVNTTRFYLTNTGTARGDVNVKEAFGELAIPLLKNVPLAEALDLNGAVRYTDYSTSGGVATWKVGGTWAPLAGLRFRVTRSRDIRAPTLYDLYAGPQFTQGSALDPHTNISGTFFQRTSGNPNLKPEVAKTWSFGLVLQPKFLPGFAASIDAYAMTLNGAIATLASLQTLQDCEDSGGTAPSCANITRPLPFSDKTPANYPTEVSVVGTNIAVIKTRGIDIDASYRAHIGPGRAAIRLYASYIDKFQTQLSSNQPLINFAGYNAAGAGGVAGAIPKVKGALSLSYDLANVSAFVQENVIGKIKLGPTLVYAEPAVPAQATTDIMLTVRPSVMRGHAEVFFSVTNLFDKKAPLVYGFTAPGIGLSTIQNLYDTTGRQFTAGVRSSF
jgi:outer membrane receptor protein involved in Fe transport